MAEPACQGVDLFKTIAPIGSWVLVIAGWFIVRRDQNRRELRKEVRALIDSVLDQVDTLEDDATTYFTTTDGSSGSGMGAAIRSSLKSIGVDVKHVYDASKGKIDAQEHLISLRKAITAGDFDSAARVAVADDHSIFDDIRSEVLSFRGHLQGSFIRFDR